MPMEFLMNLGKLFKEKSSVWDSATPEDTQWPDVVQACLNAGAAWSSLVKEKKEKKEADGVHVPHRGLQGTKQDPALV